MISISLNQNEKNIIRFGSLESYLIWLDSVCASIHGHCFAINIKEIISCCVLNVYLWSLSITKWSKEGINGNSTYIWGCFSSKHIDPLSCSDHDCGYRVLQSGMISLVCSISFQTGLVCTYRVELGNFGQLWSVALFHTIFLIPHSSTMDGIFFIFFQINVWDEYFQEPFF